jgi:hypothetical protein
VLGVVLLLVVALATNGRMRLAAAQNESLPRDEVVEKARALWQVKHTRSAIEVLRAVANDSNPSRRASAQVLLGDIYFFKGWESEGAFPGWHEESEYRDQAVAAYRAAQAARPDWFAPHVGLGRALLRDDKPADALVEFDTALKKAPDEPSALVGRWQALKASGRQQTALSEVAKAALSNNAEVLGAAREGDRLLDNREGADGVAARLTEKFPESPAAAAVLADRVAAARTAKQFADVLDLGSRFAKQYPSNPRLVGVYDAMLAAYQATPMAPVAEVVAAIDARTKLCDDPGPRLAGASLLISRKAELDKAIALAEASVPAADTFINENLSSYKMSGKSSGALARTRASAADLVGWARFQRNDLAGAESKLLESERLSRGLDTVNQVHLGDVMRTKGDLDLAREHYLVALSLGGTTAGPLPVQVGARTSLAGVHVKLGNDPALFDTYLDAEMTRRREVRRNELVTSMVDREMPAIRVADLEGRAIDLAALRGKVLLLNFFSSW